MAIGLLLEGAINLIAALIEILFSLAGKDKKLGRAKFRRKTQVKKNENPWFGLGLIIVLIGGIFVIPLVLNQKIQFIAEDGHSIPFAEFVIYKEQNTKNKRTNVEGVLEFSRFGVNEIKLNDPRYNNQVWTKEDFKGRLEVTRSNTGKLLDKTLLNFLKKEEESNKSVELTSEAPPHP